MKPGSGRTGRLFCAMLLILSGCFPAVAQERSASTNYVLRCLGCHGMDGAGSTIGGIPPFPGYIDSLFADDQGRTYLMHVPGIVASSLTDREIAEVMNYVMTQWGEQETFTAFTVDEVARRRAEPVTDVVAFRRTLVERLAQQGLPIADYPWP